MAHLTRLDEIIAEIKEAAKEAEATSKANREEKNQADSYRHAAAIIRNKPADFSNQIAIPEPDTDEDVDRIIEDLIKQGRKANTLVQKHREKQPPYNKYEVSKKWIKWKAEHEMLLHQQQQLKEILGDLI